MAMDFTISRVPHGAMDCVILCFRFISGFACWFKLLIIPPCLLGLFNLRASRSMVGLI